MLTIAVEQAAAMALQPVYTSSPLLSALSDVYDFRQILLSMLRPLDIISLVWASGLQLSKTERKKYMIWWRQLFFDMEWMNTLAGHHCTTTIIGNDLRLLNSALKAGNWLDPSIFKLVIVIGESSITPQRPFDDCHNIIESFDTKVIWHQVPSTPLQLTPVRVHQRSDNIQTCVLSIVHDTRANLDHSWTRVLSHHHRGVLPQSCIGLGKPYSTPYDIWESQGQRVESGVLTYSPTHMHYVVRSGSRMTYSLRLFVNGAGLCCAVFLESAVEADRAASV